MNQYTQQKTVLTMMLEAITSVEFNRKRIGLAYLFYAYDEARRRSFKRIIQALFREQILDKSMLVVNNDGTYTMKLCTGSGEIVFYGLSFYRMDSVIFNGKVIYVQQNGDYINIEIPSHLIEVLRENFVIDFGYDAVTNLCIEVDNSMFNDVICLAYHKKWNEDLSVIDLFNTMSEYNRLIVLEQWGCMGHPWHPNYKTKLGLTTNDIIKLSPEFNTKIPIRLCAVHQNCFHIEYMKTDINYIEWWQSHFPELFAEFGRELKNRNIDLTLYFPVTVHPWQFEHELPILFANEINSGTVILLENVKFMAYPGMSFRTVYPDFPCCHFAIKMPVSIRLTSAQRTVTPRSAQMGPRISVFLNKLLAADKYLSRYLRIVSECIGGHYISAQDDLARHLSFIIRENPASLISEDEFIIPVGSLFAEDERGQPLVAQLISAEKSKGAQQQVIDFFEKYTAVVLAAVLGIYLRYGVAFEAHQQNSFVVMDKNFQLRSVLIRDFGDIRINKKYAGRYGAEIKQYDSKFTLLDDVNYVREKLIHNVFMCHLGELLLLLSISYSVTESVLWNVFAKQTENCFLANKEQMDFADWQREKEAIMEKKWPLKSFVRMRLQNTISDIVMEVDNPLAAVL